MAVAVAEPWPCPSRGRGRGRAVAVAAPWAWQWPGSSRSVAVAVAVAEPWTWPPTGFGGFLKAFLVSVFEVPSDFAWVPLVFLAFICAGFAMVFPIWFSLYLSRFSIAFAQVFLQVVF